MGGGVAGDGLRRPRGAARRPVQGLPVPHGPCLPHALIPLFAGNQGAVLLQECRLLTTSVGEMRRLVHCSLPHYSLIAGRPTPALRHRISQIQVVTLVHINLAARVTDGHRTTAGGSLARHI